MEEYCSVNLFKSGMKMARHFPALSGGMSHVRFLARAFYPVSIIYESIVGRYRAVSYPDGPITARYRFM